MSDGGNGGEGFGFPQPPLLRQRNHSYPFAFFSSIFVLSLTAAAAVVIVEGEFGFEVGWLLAPSLVCLVVSLVGIAVDFAWERKRVPPAYKIRNDVRKLMLDLGFITRYEWSDWESIVRASVRVMPRKGMAVVELSIRHPEATLERLRSALENGSTVFEGAQMVTVEESFDRRGLKRGYRVNLFYRPVSEIYEV